jgi:ABC-type nickel/cobalt efflux system permease component RcnA
MLTLATLVPAVSAPVLAISLPSVELLFIIAFGSILPIAFFIWLKWWLGSVEEENPDRVIAEQAKMDKAHHGHPAAQGHGHGHAHDHGHAHA